MRREKSAQRKKVMLLWYVLFLLMLSACALVMPIASRFRETAPYLVLISASLFWIGLIGTVVTACKINTARKNSYAFKEKNRTIKQLGLICFFKNKEAMVADIAMFASIIGVIITVIVNRYSYWLYACCALLVVAFGLHCMLNGKNYIYLNYQVRREEKS